MNIVSKCELVLQSVQAYHLLCIRVPRERIVSDSLLKFSNFSSLKPYLWFTVYCSKLWLPKSEECHSHFLSSV